MTTVNNNYTSPRRIYPTFYILIIIAVCTLYMYIIYYIYIDYIGIFCYLTFTTLCTRVKLFYIPVNNTENTHIGTYT